VKPTFIKTEDLISTQLALHISIFLLTVKSFLFAHRIYYMERFIFLIYINIPGQIVLMLTDYLSFKVNNILFDFWWVNYFLSRNVCIYVIYKSTDHVCNSVGCTGSE